VSGGSDPKGYSFYDLRSRREMRLVIEGTWKDWIIYKHPDGQWVSHCAKLHTRIGTNWQRACRLESTIYDTYNG
jgi:hypothetical protein